MNGPESDPTVRVLLVETTGAHSIYEGFGSWSQCRRWVAQITECAIFGDQFAAIEKCLEMKRLATIKEVQVSLYDLESVGFHRADC
jgi:hypothetical protein